MDRRIRWERQGADGVVEFCVVESIGRDVSITRGRGDEQGVRTTQQASNELWAEEMYDKAVRRISGEGFTDPVPPEPSSDPGFMSGAARAARDRGSAEEDIITTTDTATRRPEADPPAGAGRVSPRPTERRAANANHRRSRKSKPMDINLSYLAGTVAEKLGWSTTGTLISGADVSTQPPSGSPLLITASAGGLTAEFMRQVAALHAAGRQVALICDTQPAQDLAAWVPESLIHTHKQPEPTTPAYRFGIDWPYGSNKLIDFWEYSEDLCESEQAANALATLVESTTIEANLDVEWWMAGSKKVHEGNPRSGESGWDSRSDLVGDLGAIIAIPFILDGKYHALGVGGISGQYANEGSFILTSSSWSRGDYTYTSNWGETLRMDSLGVELLLNSFSPRPIDPYPYPITQVPNGVEFFDQFFRFLMLAILDGVLHTGRQGFQQFIPHLNPWIASVQREEFA